MMDEQTVLFEVLSQIEQSRKDLLDNGIVTLPIINISITS